MEITMRVSSKAATTKAAAYTDILQQTVAHIVQDKELNPYELASISKFTNVLRVWMDEEATKRKSSTMPNRGDH
jgi:hypothetical protein